MTETSLLLALTTIGFILAVLGLSIHFEVKRRTEHRTDREK